MPYTKKEYDSMITIRSPSDDVHVMGERPLVKNTLNNITDKVKTIEYLLEEIRSHIEVVKENVDKI